MTKTISGLLLVILLCSTVCATDQYLPGQDNRFQLAENKSGGGFYWVDTSNGRTWKLEPSRKSPSWIYCGKPSSTFTGTTGSFIPYSNRNGSGIYVLNTGDGRGWFYDGRKWIALGKPIPRTDENK